MRILIASPRQTEELRDFINGLHEEAEAISKAPTGKKALKLIDSFKPDLVVVDEKLEDYEPFRLVTEIIKSNPMIQTAVMTRLSPDSFHERGEGLGILSAVPGKPGDRDARKLIKKLHGVIA